MVWKSLTFVRADLYEAVWSAPVTKVAKTYGISDVALRKVCKRLGVPLPQAGHWSKVAHGKPTYRPPLPEGDYPAQYRSSRHTEADDDELQRRLEAARTTAPPPLTLITRSRLPECHRIVQRTAVSLGKGYVGERGWTVTRGASVLSVCVTRAAQHRALMVCDLVLQALRLAGLEVVETDTPYLVIDGYQFGWRLREYGRHVAEEHANPSNSAGAQSTFTGTGKLHLDFLEYPQGKVILTLRDSLMHTLEELMPTLPQQLLAQVQHRHIRDMLRAERELAELERRLARVQQAERRIAELERLERTEKEAQQWHRARVLRDYAAALRTATVGGSADTAQARRAEAQWIERSADWLDPTVRGRWPEVDDAPQEYWL